MKNIKNSNASSKVIGPGELIISKEVRYIIRKAQDYQGCVISLGALIFFSTETGDAWMLDSEDYFAMNLAIGGEEQDYKINETSHNFNIEWKADFKIEDDKFILMERSGRVRTILGYPIREIVKFMQVNNIPKRGKFRRAHRDFYPTLKPVLIKGPEPSRNEPCPCGSGKKYKKCCGQ